MTTAVLTGQAKRRARTRAALLEAGRALLSEGHHTASIEEITTRAHVGFGSFFNHFPGGKEEFFEEAVLEVLDLYASWLTDASADLDDPAEIFSRSFRLTGRLAAQQPGLFAPLMSRGSEVLLFQRGLRDAAMKDLTDGVTTGRFAPSDPEVHLMCVGGLLLGMVRMLSVDPSRGTPETVDAIAAGALRLLGVDAEEADELVTRPLPDLTVAAVSAT